MYSLTTKAQKERYKEELALIGSLSKLFSNSNEPYLYYRIAEKIFCNSFDAEDRSRSDVSVDATKEDIGIGLKTFLHKNGKNLEKVAEFNALKTEYDRLDIKDIVMFIAESRNKRIIATKNQYGSEKMIYHLVTRLSNEFRIYETQMDLINLDKIKNINKKRNSIKFCDNLNEYSFNLSKSTLFKRFILENKQTLDSFNVSILNDPILFLNKIYSSKLEYRYGYIEDRKNEIYLPLYITRPTTIKGKFYDYGEVQPQSCLNQFNAGGRTRNEDEVYIPVPIIIHKLFSGFFPNNNKDSFDLILPNGKSLNAKMCQVNQKGLMSNPNKALGKWLLRDVLKLEPWKIVTRAVLNQVGIDSVQIVKLDSKTYKIDFAGLGKYEEFMDFVSDNI